MVMPAKKKTGSVDDWAEQGMHRVENPRSKSRTIPASRFDKSMRETEGMVASGEWDDCGARHLVALYAILHRKIYGIESEMTSTDRYQATMLAGNFAKRHFGGEHVEVAEYMRWIWNREAGREKWRRENSREGGHLGVRLVFSAGCVTEYRLAMARKK